MAAECGKTIDQGDPEVTEAIDFAHYYAERGRELDRVDGRPLQPVAADGGDAAVELPGRDPGRVDAGGARRRLSR